MAQFSGASRSDGSCRIFPGCDQRPRPAVERSGHRSRAARTRECRHGVEVQLSRSNHRAAGRQGGCGRGRRPGLDQRCGQLSRTRAIKDLSSTALGAFPQQTAAGRAGGVTPQIDPAECDPVHDSIRRQPGWRRRKELFVGSPVSRDAWLHLNHSGGWCAVIRNDNAIDTAIRRRSRVLDANPDLPEYRDPGLFPGVGLLSHYFIVGMTNSGPCTMLVGQRLVTVLSRV